MIGPFINGVAIVAGSLLGAAFGRRFPERLKTALPLSFGVCALGIGVTLVVKLAVLPPVVLSLLLGSATGELVRLEDGLGVLAKRARGLLADKLPTGGDESADTFVEKYVALLVLFCASGMGIFGAINEGLGNGPMMLATKAILDFFTAMIFAASLGPTVALIALPQIAVQALLAFGAAPLSSAMTGELMGNFSACGGLIMLATGLRISGIKNFPIANLLPALVFVIPLSAFWLAVF
jgi:hypothetical protein